MFKFITHFSGRRCLKHAELKDNTLICKKCGRAMAIRRLVSDEQCYIYVLDQFLTYKKEIEKILYELT